MPPARTDCGRLRKVTVLDDALEFLPAQRLKLMDETDA